MVKRYLLCPGFVYSRRDNNRHWIDARVLAHLYKVSMDECVIKPTVWPATVGWRDPPDLIRLEPQNRREDYKIPQTVQHFPKTST